MEINTVLHASEDSGAPFKGPVRLVARDELTAYLIGLEKPVRAPFPVPLSVIDEGIRQERISICEDCDDGLPACIRKMTDDEQKKHDALVRIMDSLTDDERVIWDPEMRGREFKRISSESGISVRHVRRIFYRFLRGGQTPSALRPLIHLRGGPGRPQNPGTGRRGRKCRNGRSLSAVARPEMLEKLEKGARRFFFREKRALEDSYHLTQQYYFKQGYKINRDGETEAVLLPEEFLPTYGQFRYACIKLREKEGLEHEDQRYSVRPKKKEAILFGRARDGVHGPGWRYEIDATKLQIQMVSRYGRHLLIGSPTLYVIVDVWSGAYVGYAFSLENSGYRLAARALFNCNEDKGAVFKRLDLSFTSEDWPCNHLPKRLLSDRELANSISRPIPEIGIKLEFTPSMRPDRKGLVEGAINRLKHGNSFRTPGEYAKRPGRREPDGKDDASLDHEELERIIVTAIRDLNNDPVPMEHIPPEMVEQGVTDISYIGLFKWGLKHRPGHTRIFKPWELYEYLMTRDEARVTPGGILFNNQTYTSERLQPGAVRLDTSGRGLPKIEIRYDEHNAGVIWFFDVEQKKWVQAVNDDEDVRDLKAAFYELELLRDQKHRLREDAKHKAVIEADNNYRKVIAPMIRNAELEAKEDKEGLSKTQRRQNIRLNREIDKLGNRLTAERLRLEDYTGDHMPVTVEPEETSQAVEDNPGETVREEAINAEHVKQRSISKLSKKLLIGGN